MSIVAILDTNSDPTDIQFPIPGNDDARRSINLYCDLFKNTILTASKFIQSKTIEKEDKEKTISKKLDEKKTEYKEEKKKSN